MPFTGYPKDRKSRMKAPEKNENCYHWQAVKGSNHAQTTPAKCSLAKALHNKSLLLAASSASAPLTTTNLFPHLDNL
jgi:hypothetical protein